MAPPSKDKFSVNDESSPEGHWNGKYDDFKALGDNLDIPTFQKSAEPFGAAQSLLLTTYEELSTQAYRLADKWQGKTAAEFQNNLRALYVTACNLADATGQVNVAIGYHASDLQTLKDNVDKMKPADNDFMDDAGDVFFGDSWDPLGISHRTTNSEQHQDNADSNVNKWVNQDLTHNTTTYTFGELPKQVDVEIPNPTPGASTPDPSGLPKTGPLGGAPNMGGLGPHSGGSTPHLNSPNPHLNSPNPHLNSPNPHLNNPPNQHLTPPNSHPLNPPGSHGGANLAGLNPHGGPGGLDHGLGGGGGGLKGLDPHGLGGGGGGLKGLDPHGLGGGGGGLSGSGLGGGGLKGTGGPGKAGGLAGAAAEEEAAAARAAAAGRGGTTGGMPMGMGGGGHGGQEQERERTTWLTEDEDIWGGGDDAAPPVIG